MRTVLGLIFILLSFLGILYFRSYEGYVIPYPMLWYGLSALLSGVGGYLLWLDKFGGSGKYDRGRLAKHPGRYSVKFELVEFSEITTKYVLPKKQDAGNHTPPASKMSTGSQLRYQDKDIRPGKWFQAEFPVDLDTLKSHVAEGRLYIYVDKGDIDDYFFRIEE